MTQTVRRPDGSPAVVRGTTKVWWMAAIIAGAAAAIWYSVLDLPVLRDSPQLPWWALAIGFYVSELAVVHLRFRKDAHSFSMSEIPLVLGLFFATPAHLALGQLVGTAAVYAFHRRLPPIKFAFNIAQFAFQGALAITVFRGIVALGDPLGMIGWLAAVSASLVAVIAADLLINVAIRLTGGRVPRHDLLQVLALSSLAGSMNASLAVSAVVVLWAAPSASWLALMPPVILFLAYRAYVSQRHERAKLESLYEATRSLHRSPQIEAALVAACRDATRMLDAEYTEILLFSELNRLETYWTAVGPGDRLSVMQPADLPLGAWERLADVGQATLLNESDASALCLPPSDRGRIEEAIVAPLTSASGLVGVIIVFNRVGDISSFAADDVPLLDTLANQISVSLENGRLEDSLSQLTALKERLENVIKSKDEFVASVSHELRTPLTAVVGLSHELHDNWSIYDGGDAREIVNLIASQSSELSDIIEDLLVAARADIGTLALQSRRVDLRSEIEAVIAGHCVISGRPAPTVEIGPDADVIWSDPLRFRQIIRNLLSNAARYGGSNVSVHAFRKGPRVTVAVRDDGPGVPLDRAETIFEPYTSAHEPGSQPGSVGLGLAVSRTLAQLMDGDLVYNGNGGVAFELTIPADDSTR
ncbi:MAG: ATP-binding protein [Acidimicrobiia bacterium]|nr:ATP-binding protein [Acidimicrobiia bacterium]MDH3397063.1 ATP-binding protein [Acidimicrobiia bacterium]